jgi:hypothetical protein
MNGSDLINYFATCLTYPLSYAKDTTNSGIDISFFKKTILSTHRDLSQRDFPNKSRLDSQQRCLGSRMTDHHSTFLSGVE